MSQDKWRVTVARTIYTYATVTVYASDVIGAKSEALTAARQLDDDEFDISCSDYEVDECSIAE